MARAGKRLGKMSRPDVSATIHDAIHDKGSDALSHVHTQQPLSHSSATLHLCVLRHNAKPL